MMDEMSASLIRYADNGGLIPRGPCAGGYTYIMSGCPVTPLIVSTYNKGLMTKCDPMHAFKTMQRNHMPGGMMGIGDYYLENGYQPGNAGMTIESNFSRLGLIANGYSSWSLIMRLNIFGPVLKDGKSYITRSRN